MKEVIQGHLPVALPCYDFIKIKTPTVGSILRKTVGFEMSNQSFFPHVTGGVYKTRERIHRCVADQRLLAIPASCSRVSDYNPNWG